MEKVSYSVLNKAELELNKNFDNEVVMFFHRGDGVISPIHLIVSPRGCSEKEPDEAIKTGQILIEAGKAAKEFKYNGYFVDWSK
jgi:S-adenosylmethionine synthetase|nr:MAG TPA: hypothetical protein [Caudoviricetes sp.]